MTYVHEPVLLSSAIDDLLTAKDGIYIDGTYGRGGHSREILSRLSASAQLLVCDQDIEAVASAQRLSKEDGRMQVFHENFRHLKKIAERCHAIGNVAGLLLDVGVSSPQLDNPNRGFSFQHDGPLDMRMNSQQGMSALEWLKSAQLEQIRQAFKTFADVRGAGRWARLIKRGVLLGEIHNTQDLVALIECDTPKKVRMQMRHHPATRIFQAIRMAVNDEVAALRACLQDAFEVLAQDGRLVVLSFHSVEHRLLRAFTRGENQTLPNRFQPQHVAQARWRVIRLLDYPSESEIARNRRARSARLTVLEKL